MKSTFAALGLTSHKETNNEQRLTHFCVSALSSRFAGRLHRPDGAEASERLPDSLLTQPPVGGRGRGVTFDLGRAEFADDVEASGVVVVARQRLQGHEQVQRGLIDGSLDLHRKRQEAAMNKRVRPRRPW